MDNRIALSTTPATAEQLIDISPSRRTSDLDNVDLILLYSYEWMEVTRAVGRDGESEISANNVR